MALDEAAAAVNKPLGPGSTDRTVPANLQEQLVMQQAISNPAVGRQLPIPVILEDESLYVRTIFPAN
jgi:hypothetical protein